jgi:hypothetical protein
VSGNESYRDRKPLRERIAFALGRRVGPGKAMTVKQLSHALPMGETTIWALLAGNRDPSGRVLDDLLAFFDASFMQEIYGESHGCVVAKLSDRRAAAAIRKLNEARAELARAMGEKP